jgi:N-acetylmuramoyl-L-alanine amidase
MTCILLDNGHGGFKDGVYTTAPAKMYQFDNGDAIYEGMFNRQIVDKLSRRLKEEGIPFEIIVPEREDISLKERVRRANEIFDKGIYENYLFLSMHGNYFDGSNGGFELYTYFGETKSDEYATVIGTEIEKEFPNQRMRWDLSDGDIDKEANFYVLKHTKMSAVLCENFFMNVKNDFDIMTSEEGQERLVEAYVKAIKQL